MSNRAKVYYVGDATTFRGSNEIDRVAQTPDAGSAKALIMKYGETIPVVPETDATISGTQISYKYTPLVVGRFTIYFTAEYNSGADKRSGVIEFIVRKKESH